jgi:hypothetical protein
MIDDLQKSFLDLTVEQWRLIRVLERLIDRLPIEAQARVAAQARFATSKLNDIVTQSGFQIETFDGRTFEPSLPVTTVNADEFTGDIPLHVRETLEPTVLCDGHVLKLGKVALGQGATDASRN